MQWGGIDSLVAEHEATLRHSEAIIRERQLVGGDPELPDPNWRMSLYRPGFYRAASRGAHEGQIHLDREPRVAHTYDVDLGVHRPDCRR